MCVCVCGKKKIVENSSALRERTGPGESRLKGGSDCYDGGVGREGVGRPHSNMADIGMRRVFVRSPHTRIRFFFARVSPASPPAARVITTITNLASHCSRFLCRRRRPTTTWRRRFFPAKRNRATVYDDGRQTGRGEEKKKIQRRRFPRSASLAAVIVRRGRTRCEDAIVVVACVSCSYT